MWFLTPFTFHEYDWYPDSQIIVSKVLDESPGNTLVVGDRILRIDEQPVRRLRPVYPLPIQDEYEFTVLRGETVQKINVPASPINSIGVGYRLPAGIISFLGLFVGGLILLIAPKNNKQAIHIGAIFLLASITIIGIQGGLFGVPGAWIGGHFLVFFLCLGWLYLGTLPRDEPLSSRMRKIFKSLFLIAGILASISLFEVIVLFPRVTSIQEISGLSMYSFGFLLSSLCLIIAAMMIIFRAFRRYDSPYHRQQIRILAVFICIGIFPAVFLTIIPDALFDAVFLPFPVAIALLGFIPAGYFYIIYRRGYLHLDLIFSRIAVFMILAMMMLLIYSVGLHIIHTQFNISSSAIVPAVLMFLPILLVTMYTRGPVHKAIQGLFFGPIASNQSIPTFVSALSSNPELITLQDMLNRLAFDFRAQRAILLLKDRNNLYAPVAQVKVENAGCLSEFDKFLRPQLRSARTNKMHNSLFETYSWAEILVPVVIRGEQVGFLAMSRPFPNGFYNAEQVAYLSRMADMIAVGSEAISLFDASRKLSLELLSSREDERRSIASEIHDGPVQELVFLTQEVRNIVHKSNLQPDISQKLTEQAAQLQGIVVQLRDVCTGLYPPFIDQGVKFIVEALAHKFLSEHGLNIEIKSPDFDDSMLPQKVCRTVYRVLLESLTNVVKHAQTKNVEIELDYTGAQVFLSISDDGIGCSLQDRSVSELIRQSHTGVVGMFEWAELVSGSLSIQQNKPSGTIVILEVPL